MGSLKHFSQIGPAARPAIKAQGIVKLVSPLSLENCCNVL